MDGEERDKRGHEGAQSPTPYLLNLEIARTEEVVASVMSVCMGKGGLSHAVSSSAGAHAAAGVTEPRKARCLMAAPGCRGAYVPSDGMCELHVC